MLVWMWCLVLGCSESGFHSLADEGAGDETGPPDRPPRDTGGTVDTEGGDSAPPIDTGPPDHEPLVCSVDSMVHMVGSGPQDCPDDHAAFMMDDGNGPNFICCPLPAADILREVPGNERGTTCNPNEVITGFSGAYALRCTPINLDRYQVGPAQEPCYFGSGASGGSGVPGCAEHPHSWDVLQQNLFGSDGCSGYPYGSLFVSQTGKHCDDMRTKQVLYNGLVSGDPTAGTPVEMFPQ